MAVSYTDLKICFREVDQFFRIVYDRPTTLREAFARSFRRSSNVHAFQALKGVSFQARAGETLGIIGRNGSGKSTILKIIAGVYSPTAGEVEVKGHVSPLIELGAGFDPELTGRENVILGGALMGVDPLEMKDKMEAILAFAELDEFIDVPIKQYSSGMYARLGFAVATEINPDILLVDEILAVGDGAFQRKCLERMDNFHRQDKTIIFVSHDLGSVQRLCDRVLLLDHGRVLAEGSPEQVIARYQELLKPQPAAKPA